MKSLVPLTLRRWADIFLLAAIGAAAFEAVIPLGWYYAALLPDLTSWFSPWFARIVVLLALLVIAFIAVEPIGFRTRHLRLSHRYPPLWFAVVIAIGLAWILDTRLRALQPGVVPQWQRVDILLPLAVIGVLALALRQVPWRSSARQSAEPHDDAAPTWELLRQWFEREEPLDTGPDLFGHAPIAHRISSALQGQDDRAIALIGPIGSGKTSILKLARRDLLSRGSPLFVVAEFTCWAMPRPEDAPRMALERAVDALGSPW